MLILSFGDRLLFESDGTAENIANACTCKVMMGAIFYEDV
jgi:hypothetical protein